MRVTYLEALKLAKAANKLAGIEAGNPEVYEAPWYVSEDKNGNPIVVNSNDASWLNESDVKRLFQMGLL